MPEDFADRHVARWRNHWIDVPFNERIEAAVVRMGAVVRYLRQSKQRALDEVGLRDFEFDTLHRLMIRDTPGRASPTDLADDLAVSAAGMTGRLDALEKGGYVQRVPNAGDRRRVDVEATKDGVQVWRRAMALRGTTEEELLGALSERELASFNRLLKKLALHVEAHEDS